MTLPLGHRPQRIRDPLHNLIEFKVDPNDQLEYAVWDALQTRPFQRLRRIRQLGFSEFVYPGATHTRFAHSIGTFHTARRLVGMVERLSNSGGARGYRDYQAKVALGAALVHDLGHGMFSHAFEEVGRTLKLPMAHHEHVSDLLIRDTEIRQAFSEMGPHFADDVADVVKGPPRTLYDAVVSSQFDADRLDYRRRDRLMTGVQNSGIDFDWLMANLEIAPVQTGVDDQSLSSIDTFVLGSKAFHAAETYVLALFQLYPTVYLHKTTRAAEKLFTALVIRLVTLVHDGLVEKTGLPFGHPLVRFALDPENLANALALDDAVFWGALPVLAEADDPIIRRHALGLRDRRLPKCFDLRAPFDHVAPGESRENRKKRLDLSRARVGERLKEWSSAHSGDCQRILLDYASRTPYKRVSELTATLSRIHIREANGDIRDMIECSPVVAGIETFESFRAYYDEDDHEALAEIKAAVVEELGRTKHD